MNFIKVNFVRKILAAQRGGALVYVMMAVVGLGVVSYITMHNKKQMSKNEIKELATREIDDAVARIAGLFISPAHCNANLSNVPQASSNFTTSIRACAVGSTCYGGSGPYDTTRSIPIYNEAVVNNPAQWDPAATKLPDRIRLVSARYAIVKVQATGGSRGPAQVDITIRLQLNLGQRRNSASLGVNMTAQQAQNAGITDYYITDTRIVEKVITAYAVTHGFNYSTHTMTNHPSTRFYGCPRAPASTVPFNAP